MDVLELFKREDNKYLDLLPNVLLNEKSLDNDEEKERHLEKYITTIINNKLEQAATFCSGLYLFDKFVPKLSKDSLAKYFAHWISKLTQKLHNGNPEELQAVCKSIAVLIACCKQEPDLDKKISLYHVKQLLGIIVELYDKKSHLCLLNLLTVLLYHYPESCGRLQASCSSIISSSLDYEDCHLINASAKCYALLVRSNERQFMNSYKDNYVAAPDNSSASCHIYYQINLCHRLHDIMDKLFQNFVTATAELPLKLQNAKSNNILCLPEISQKDVFEYYGANINRFTNICTFLATLLKTGSSGRKFTLPNVILHVACRGLSITPANLKKSDETRKNLLLLILPKLYTGLLNVMEALITSFQQQLIPFAFNIQKLILQTLEWTQTFYNELFKDIRLHAYKLLSIWLHQARSLSGFQLVADEVLIHILKDISQTTSDKVQMLKAVKSLQNNSKTEKQSKSISNGTTDSASYLGNTDSTLRLRVLSTVESIVSNASCHLKQSFFDRIRNAVVLLLYDQYMKKSQIPSGENEVNHRLQLLKSLRVLETNAQGSSSTSHAIHIFDLATSKESDSEIIAEARSALAELRHIIYPTAPTLALTPEKSESASVEESSLFRTLRLEEIVPAEPTPQIPEAIPSTPSVTSPCTTRKAPEDDDLGALMVNKRLKLADDTAKQVQDASKVESSKVESETSADINETKLDEVSDSNAELENSSLETKSKQNETGDPNEEEMASAFCDWI